MIEVAGKRVGVRIDEAEFVWVRQLEAIGLVDNASEWSWRR